MPIVELATLAVLTMLAKQVVAAHRAEQPAVHLRVLEIREIERGYTRNSWETLLYLCSIPALNSQRIGEDTLAEHG